MIACRTNNDGPSKNVPCVLPFAFKGKDHHKCIWDKDGSWCSTKVDKFAIHIGGGNFWGYCNPNCPMGNKPKGKYQVKSAIQKS